MQAAHAHHVVEDDAAGEAGQEVGLVILLAVEEEGDVEKLGDGGRYNDEPDLHQHEDIEDDAVGDAQGRRVYQRRRVDGRRLRWCRETPARHLTRIPLPPLRLSSRGR